MPDACTELQALLGCKLNAAWASKAQDEGAASCEGLLAKFLWADVSDTLEGSLPAEWGVCPCASVCQRFPTPTFQLAGHPTSDPV